jgi:hypothetical protein
MLASRRWRDWNPPAIFQECPERELTKPTEPLRVTSFVIFVSPYSARFKNKCSIGQHPAA